MCAIRSSQPESEGQRQSAGHERTLKHNARVTLRMRTAPKGCRTVVDSVSQWAKPVRLSRKVDWVGSERALSEVEGVRLTSSGEVGTSKASVQAPRQVRENDFEAHQLPRQKPIAMRRLQQQHRHSMRDTVNMRKRLSAERENAVLKTYFVLTEVQGLRGMST